MKLFLQGLGIFIFGFFLAVILAALLSSNSGNSDYSYFYGIIFSILYLAGVVWIAAGWIIEAIKNKNNETITDQNKNDELK